MHRDRFFGQGPRSCLGSCRLVPSTVVRFPGLICPVLVVALATQTLVLALALPCQLPCPALPCPALLALPCRHQGKGVERYFLTTLEGAPTNTRRASPVAPAKSLQRLVVPSWTASQPAYLLLTPSLDFPESRLASPRHRSSA